MNARSLRGVARLTFGNPASAVYLGIVGLTVLVAIVEPMVREFPDGSMSWVWPALLTMPFFSVFLTLDTMIGAEPSGAFFIAGIVVSALLQSLVIGASVEKLRGRRRGLARPRPRPEPEVG